ncbi:uncharacterized protein CTHT_0038950 [Thermochaetoides thermophila DSM 1495]|uniref:Uncharacterized protein n=1 Tax=Chaetomium thermophilum (strain DSM 1495 / CBS 144.50 / IMI 039719) TaxID=759272 RepID=G0S3U8_CHATD|nr:hypothetical protein CTHT_0038950 [Thermochaetoides thermophila DSM 1495]EGS22010.1 hypothetical protein CTHT_0038950 [Thermochaetoides thermophila DSM 1495]
MGFPTFLSRVPSRLLSDVLDGAQQLYSNGDEGVELLDLLAGLLKSGKNPRSRGPISARVLGGRDVASRSAQVNHSWLIYSYSASSDWLDPGLD